MLRVQLFNFKYYLTLTPILGVTGEKTMLLEYIYALGMTTS